MKKHLLLSLAVLTACISYGQIVYHYNGGLTYFGVATLDMDNDGYPEYDFNVISSAAQISCYGDNCVGKGSNVILFNDGQTIGPAVNWHCSGGYYSPIQAAGAGPKLLGLKFYLGNNIHYGWATIDINGGGSYVLWDWAYEATPNTPIAAGRVYYAGISENTAFEGNVNVWNGQLTVETAAGQLGDVSLYTLSGQKIYGASVKSNTATVDVAPFASGVYVLRVGNTFRKILVP